VVTDIDCMALVLRLLTGNHYVVSIKLSQEELARKTGTRKSLIARLERGNIELSTAMLNVLFEAGFGKRFAEVG
jgi:hypothetical protein